MRSPLLPFVRAYTARDRYPLAVILDLLDGEELPRVRAEQLNTLLRRNKRRCRARKQARAVARLFVALHYLPYAAQKPSYRVRRRGRRGHAVTARFTRTIPWSSSTSLTAVRSRTVVRTLTLTVSRRCRLRVRSDKVSKVIYSGD